MEGLLNDQLCMDVELQGMLASFDGKPAVFHKNLPSQADPKWPYPCVVYGIGTHQDPKRNMGGTLLLNVYFGRCGECFDGGDVTAPHNLERKLKDLINTTFYTPSPQEAPVCAAWRRSDAFGCTPCPAAGGGDDEDAMPAWGVRMCFDLVSFPVQTTTEPDPVRALNDWTRSALGSVHRIAHDPLPGVWKPAKGEPAVYWRLDSMALSDDESHSAAWFDFQVIGHVLAEDVTTRTAWLKTLAEELSMAGELPLHESTLVIRKCTIRPGAEPLREGQVIIEGSYGLVRKTHDGGELLENIYFN